MTIVTLDVAYLPRKRPAQSRFLDTSHLRIKHQKTRRGIEGRPGGTCEDLDTIHQVFYFTDLSQRSDRPSPNGIYAELSGTNEQQMGWMIYQTPTGSLMRSD